MTDNVPSTARLDGKERKAMLEGYARYLADGRKERAPRTAHVFALMMLHQGITYGRSVRDIVLDLEGALPAYWTAE